MPKFTITPEEYYAWIKDLATNGDPVRPDVPYDCESERDYACMELDALDNEPGMLEERTWEFNATEEELAMRQDQEQFERYMR